MRQDMRALRNALASISVSGANESRREQTFPDVLENLLVIDDISGARPPIIIRTYRTGELPAWIDQAFDDLRGRLVSFPDQDLLNAAREIGLERPDTSDE
jgi:hypothetical protein